MSAALEIRGITRRFGKNTAVSGVDIRIPAGQMVGIIGRSGAGKSTLLRMINRLVNPSEGSISFGGVEVSKLSGAALRRWQRDCAMIFQQFNLVPRLDVLTNVLLGRLNHRSTVSNLLGVFSREEQIEAIAALERLDIARTALQAAGTLSGGQQQRVAIARALINDPKLILADEPTGNLDTKTSEEVMAVFQRLNDDGKTVVLITHEQDIAQHAKRTVVFRDGRVVDDQEVARRRRAG
jgi:phosphonate transport system ATP-binding protein